MSEEGQHKFCPENEGWSGFFYRAGEAGVASRGRVLWEISGVILNAGLVKDV